METKQIITKEHEDFYRLMYAIDKELEHCKKTDEYECFYAACRRLEFYRGYKIDRIKTLEYLRSKGGYDDVEILLNAQFK